jgi:hypothetical protein
MRDDSGLNLKKPSMVGNSIGCESDSHIVAHSTVQLQGWRNTGGRGQRLVRACLTASNDSNVYPRGAILLCLKRFPKICILDVPKSLGFDVRDACSGSHARIPVIREQTFATARVSARATSRSSSESEELGPRWKDARSLRLTILVIRLVGLLLVGRRSRLTQGKRRALRRATVVVSR